MKILLLEPSRLLADQYILALEGAGHAVKWCRDGQAGIVAADESTPDVLIMELLLAGHSGIEFLYEFRSYAEWGTIPAIILSSVPRAELAISDETLAELGVASYLYKPASSLKKLITSVSRATVANGVQKTS